MKKIIFFLFLIISTIAPIIFAGDNENSLSYSLLLQQENSTVKLKHITLTASNPHIQTAGNENTIQILSFQKKVLYETTFNINTKTFYSPLLLEKETEKIITTSANVTIRKSPYQKENVMTLLLPYYPHAKEIVISRNETVLLIIDVSTYAVCNENGHCVGSESKDNCHQYCNCPNDDCTKKIEATNDTFKKIYYFIIFLAVISIVTISYFVLKRKKR